MSNNIEILGEIGSVHGIGSSDYIGRTVARGRCPYCRYNVSFTQYSKYSTGENGNWFIALQCDSCGTLSSLDLGESKIYPTEIPDGIDKLPDMIDKYYQEALRCIAADAPNGAATLFRKTIHALGIHYDISEVDDNITIYEIIDSLHDEGHINPKLRDQLLAVKDIGNDGAHINENEPNIKQIEAIKRLIESTLRSTVKADQDIEFARENHPNPYEEG